MIITMIFSFESAASDVINSTHIVSLPVAHETFNNAENVFELESAENTGNSLSYKTDCHGTVYGPEDYTLENNLAYILNSSNNSILVYHENSVVKNISLQDFIATNIAVDDGTLYTIGTNMKVYKIENSNPIPILDISTLNNVDGISDFQILDNKLMITTPEGNYGKTYIFDLAKVKSGQKNVPTVIEGRMIENGIYYYVLPLTEGDQLISNTCKLVIHYPDSTKEEVIINSEYGLVGVELLAVEDEVFCALISEVLSDSNYNIVYEKSLQFITKQGLTKLSYPLPAQAKGLDNPVKIINNHIYFLHNDTNNTQIEILDEIIRSDKTNISIFNSVIPLESASEYSSESIVAANTLTGADMVDIAESYRREFEWSCEDENIEYLANYDWGCPSYVTTAKSYTNMPYCWNGFDTQDSFEQGLLSTVGGIRGHVGNVNESYPGQVFGLDCSGYVSRCWNLSWKRNTKMFDPNDKENNGLTEYINISQIRTGDALNNPGDHIMLIASLNLTTDQLLVYECTRSSDYDKVVYLPYDWSSVASRYNPIRYVQ